MKKLIVYLLLFNMLFSCNSARKNLIAGSFENKGEDYHYSLILNYSNNFFLSKKYFEVNASCKGVRITKKDTITLKCNEEEFPAQILTGYLPQRELKIQILNKTELKLDNLILKKIK
ncbi:hypothetical protein [Chryseobacterium sp. CFBP8996]|uniref:hypothetical protein n=1 Tax=Chryseobacterium sp. CFBP8996 TaxID=3096529 RepID=UPI002A69E7E5|nr:hypothetical protein [Chryseobacterium sp. CFBP8996]MDY0930812.1 hypothetical protein [Chryseobacterium sp. CFBP8996]